MNGGTPEIPYYITIVLRYGKDNRITHWSVVDALNIEKPSHTTLSAKARIIRLLLDQGLDDAPYYQIWVPPYQDGEEFASGLVAYSVVAQLLDRIGVSFSRGGVFDESEFFAPTRPWFNPDAVRAESLGRAAMKAMEKLNWKARLALFPVRPFTDGQREGVDPIELAPSQTPPVLHTTPSVDPLNDLNSLFEEPKVQDAASQTVKPPGHDSTQDAPTVPVVQPDQGQKQSSSSSSSSSSAGPEPEATASQNYINAKAKDLERLREEVIATEKACKECANFTDRLLSAVLDEPKKKMIHTPSAYAVERLFWLGK